MRAPSDITVDRHAEGAVDWLPERRFDGVDTELIWFHDMLHNGPPVTPMGASLLHWPRGATYAAEALSFPYSRGFDYVLFNGRVYPCPIPVEHEAEIEQRRVEFESAMAGLLERWPEHYQSMVDEWTRHLGYLRGVRKDALPLGRLRDLLSDATAISKRSWELHFLGMYPSMTAYEALEVNCRRLGLDEHVVPLLLQGFETKMYEIDRALWWLADLAARQGLVETFTGADDLEDLYDRLHEGDPGTAWLAEFDAFLEKYGRRSTAAIFDPYYTTWLEDPYPALATILTYVRKGGFDFESHARRLIEERDRAIGEAVARIGDAAERAVFLRVLQDAQNTYPFNEDHNFYVEQWMYSELRYVIHECGRRLLALGVIGEDGCDPYGPAGGEPREGLAGDPDDVFFLTVDELESILDDLVIDERMGVIEHRRRIPSLVTRRKKRWLELHDVESPVFIGTIPERRVDDPVFVKIWGFTDEVIRGRTKPPEGDGRRVEGMRGAAGVVEGVARVITDHMGFSQVQPDDILVAPFTTPAWTPLFSKIKGVVTDSGGVLAHAAICAREYGIPSVVGTVTRGARATQVIRTGDRVRVNGTDGVIEILAR